MDGNLKKSEDQLKTTSGNQCLFSKKRLVAQENQDACLKQVVSMTALAGKAKVALMTTKISGGNNNSAALDGQASLVKKLLLKVKLLNKPILSVKITI